MYAETAEAFSESHVEKLFLFAVIWGCGGALKEQIDFSVLLKGLTNSLPDDDSVESVFDYYVDESGEWDVWQTWYVCTVYTYYVYVLCILTMCIMATYICKFTVFV